MQIFPPAYKAINDQLAKKPVWVFRIVWANGQSGTPGVNDIYFATCDVNDILNFPYPERWYPFLDADSVSGISQSVDPINGVSTIGNLSVSMVDQDNIVSSIIKAADDAGHGLRRQRCEVYMLFKGMDWADVNKVRTLQVQDLKLANYSQYTLTAADVQKQLKKTVFNPGNTVVANVAVAASGAVTIQVIDARVLNLVGSVTFGTSGFAKIDDEILRFDAKTANSIDVPAAGRGMFGTVAAAHDIGAAVNEIIYLNENPFTMALKIMQSSGVASANGSYDAYPAAWGCDMVAGQDVNEDGWLQIGQLLAGLSATPAVSDGKQYVFILDKGVEAKKFIEDNILKIMGAFGFVRANGTYSVRAYNDLANAAKENASKWITDQNAVKWGELSYNYQDVANQLWIDYDKYPPLTGKYIRSALFIDWVSIKKWGPVKQLKYAAEGVPPLSIEVNQLYQNFHRVMARYSRPPMQISITLLPREHDVEIGDIVRVSLPIIDLFTGAALDRAFEVISVALQPKTGEVDIKCIAQTEKASRWQGGTGEVVSATISPAAASIPVSTTQQLVARAFDGIGNQMPIPAIGWVAGGDVTVDANGLVTAGGSAGSGTVYAVIGANQSNAATITVTATANTNTVASVVVSPAEALLAAGQTQMMTATAFDVSGNQVNGVTFNWASDAAGVATVPGGPSVSATVTAVADGVANITATETVSAVASPNSPVTVAVPPTPLIKPPLIADSAYQIGTQLDETDSRINGSPGGPYTILDASDFASGDYWFDNDVTLPVGNTCTINGTVRIFSLGVITINGVVDGVGRGGAGANSGSAYVHNGKSKLVFGGDEFLSRGASASSVGYVGVGGIGAYSKTYSTNPTWQNMSSSVAEPQFQSQPLVSVICLSVDVNGLWTEIGGVPINAQGGGGSCGSPAYHKLGTSISRAWDGGSGGNGGAGLVIVARGIYVSAGYINLAGADSTSGSWVCPGGPGGGGSFIALAEGNIDGVPVMYIDPVKVSVAPGAPAAQAVSSFFYNYNNYVVPPSPATPGCFIHQVIS